MLGGAWIAWASIERGDCRWNWDEDWFHQRTTVSHVRWCLAHNHVDINQQDTEGRTILHRIAQDLRHDADDYIWNSDYTVRYAGNTRADILAIAREILRWRDRRSLELDILDHEGKTAFQYAVRAGKSWPLAGELLKAGASITLTPAAKQRATEQTIPLVQAVGERFKNPFAEDVDFDRLFDCQSFDCLLEETLKE